MLIKETVVLKSILRNNRPELAPKADIAGKKVTFNISDEEKSKKKETVLNSNKDTKLDLLSFSPYTLKLRDKTM